MSTIKDLNNIFIQEWERKAKEDNLEFIGSELQSILYDYISGSKTTKKIHNFNIEFCLDPFEMERKNYLDLIPIIKEKTGLIIDFPEKEFKNFHTVKDFIIYVLKKCHIDPETELSEYASYFFKIMMAKKLYNIAHEFISGLNSKQIELLKQRIDYLQSITNRGFSYSSERLAYVHSLGIRYDRFEFEKMILPVIMEGKVAEFLLITILYRALEIISTNMETGEDKYELETTEQRVINKLKNGEKKFNLEEIGIKTLNQLSNNFDKFFRLSIKYLPNEKEELSEIKTVDELFEFIIHIFDRELNLK